MKEFTEGNNIKSRYCCKYMGESCGRCVTVERTAENATDDTLNCRRKYGGNKNLTHPFIPTLYAVNCFVNFACRSVQAQPAAPTKKTVRI